jgi:hypothetical protein
MLVEYGHEVPEEFVEQVRAKAWRQWLAEVRARIGLTVEAPAPS